MTPEKPGVYNRHLALRSTGGCNSHDRGCSTRHSTKERNPSAVGRPGGTEISGWIGSEALTSVRADDLDVNIKVVPPFTLPGESDLVAIGGKGRMQFQAGIARQWRDLK